MAPLPERSETMTQRTLVQAGSPNLEKVVDTHEASGDPLDAPAGPIQLEQALAAAHLYHAKDVLAALASDADEGLRDAEVTQRSEQYGPNMLQGGDDISIWNIFVHQIANAMTLVLILAMAVSFGIESWIEGGVLAGVVGVNVGVGMSQELSAEKTMNALRSLASPTARVIRNGSSQLVPAGEVTIGDIVEVTTGDTIPADLRLIEAMNFECDEALITGESMPVAKEASFAYGRSDGGEVNVGVGDRLNMAFTSANVTKGRATGIVVAIGMKTEIGAIAEALRGADKAQKIREVKRNAHGKALPHRYVQAGALTAWDKVLRFLGLTKGTPLQRKLSLLAIALFFVAVLFAIICFLANLDADESPWKSKEVAIYAVACGVSMIPASLTAVLTITLSQGSRAMVKRHVIVRKLESLEALGGVQTICSDKTGTLTQGKMVVRKAWVPASGTYSVSDSNEPFNPTLGEVTRDNVEPSKASKDASAGEVVSDSAASSSNVKNDEHFVNFLNVSSLCNVAKVFKEEDANIDETGSAWRAHGDPTECAIQTWACRFGWGRQGLTKSDVDPKAPTDAPWTQIADYPFDSSIKRMAVTYRHASGKSTAMMKGAVERILERCSHAQTSQGHEELTDAFQARVLENMEALASGGLRVLALAQRSMSADEVSKGAALERDEVERNMTFLGLVGIYDPPRPETAGALALCKEAGITVRMCTGDHFATARAIAYEIGLLPSEESCKSLSKAQRDAMVMTAAQFDKLSEAEIDAMPELPLVIARCSPQTKVRMIDALHRRGQQAAMTGDGVNDSPSLKKADVGIAMGQAGSDVAKDASDIVLTDDSFASIPAAIEEGRRMADNIRRFVLHLLAQNIAQACVLLIGLAFKDRDPGFSVFPLSPIEVLWIIMITSSAPAMGLGLQFAEPDVMQRPPDNVKWGIFTPEVMLDTVVYGFWMAAFTLATFTLSLFAWEGEDLGRDCNASLSYNDSCVNIYRARGACFTFLTWASLFLACEVISMRQSFFRMHKTHSIFTQWFHDLYRNRVLFWSVAFGFVTVFPVLYIPGLNRLIFLHTGISWEWAIVFISTFLFVLGIEGWKWVKRNIIFRREAQTSAHSEKPSPA